MDYQSLYAIQDRVLAAVFSGQTEFYLTGDTCLHRFYANKRHSDDLDLFTSETNLYREDVRLALERAADAGISYETIVDTRDFVRVVANGSLRVDFVNDRVYRYGAAEKSTDGYRMDNLTNILANKICAVMGRDEPKDVFDLCTLHSMEAVQTHDVLPIVQKKCVIDLEELAYRLTSFPVSLFDALPVIDAEFTSQLKRNYAGLSAELLEGLGA